MHGRKRIASIEIKDKFKGAAKNAWFKFGFGWTSWGYALRTRSISAKTVQNSHFVTGQKLHTDVEQFFGRDEKTCEWHLPEPPKQTASRTPGRSSSPLAPSCPLPTPSPTVLDDHPATTLGSRPRSGGHSSEFFQGWRRTTYDAIAQPPRAAYALASMARAVRVQSMHDRHHEDVLRFHGDEVPRGNATQSIFISKVIIPFSSSSPPEILLTSFDGAIQSKQLLSAYLSWTLCKKIFVQDVLWMWDRKFNLRTYILNQQEAIICFLIQTILFFF